jgi:multidrug resistance efflux pump
MILYIVARFAGNLTRGISGDWAFIPATAAGLLIFRSRIKTLVAFMNTVYLDKKERLRAWFTPQRLAATGVAAAVLVFVPFWRDSIEGRFVFEPRAQATLRANVPGLVQDVVVQEGQRVKAGDLLVSMRNLDLQSNAGMANAKFVTASARYSDAQVHFEEFTQAEHEREESRAQAQQAMDRLGHLTVRSPIDGVVASERLQDLQNRYVKEGTELLTVADTSRMKARIYVPEFDLRKVVAGEKASLLVEGQIVPLPGTVESILPASEEIQDGLMHKTDYKGIRPPKFYVVTIVVPNDGSLRIGMPGTAKVFHGHTSLAGMLWEPLWDTISRKIW